MGWFLIGVLLFIAVNLHGWINKDIHDEIKSAKKKSGLWDDEPN